MRLIADTNRIIAALIRNSTSARMFTDASLKLYSISLSKAEINSHKQELLEKSGLSEQDFVIVVEGIFSMTSILDDLTIQEAMEEAKSIMDSIDKGDSPFIAAALAFGMPIWSDDKHFQQQKKVTIFTTKSLLQVLEKKT